MKEKAGPRAKFHNFECKEGGGRVEERKYKSYNTYNGVGWYRNGTDMKLRCGMGRWGVEQRNRPTFFSLFDAVSIVSRLRSPLRRWDREKRVRASVGPPAVAVVGRLVGLGLLRDGAGLATLPAARLQGWEGYGGGERCLVSGTKL